jgi:hypothetical protein
VQTPICFGTEVPSSGSLKTTSDHKCNIYIQGDVLEIRKLSREEINLPGLLFSWFQASDLECLDRDNWELPEECFTSTQDNY